MQDARSYPRDNMQMHRSLNKTQEMQEEVEYNYF